MNTLFFTTDSVKKLFTLVTLSTLLATSFPLGVLTALGATDEVKGIAITSSPQTINANEISGGINVQTQNASGTSEQLNEGVTFTLTSSSLTGEFSAASNFNSTTTNITVASSTANRNFWYRDTTAGEHTITVDATSHGWGTATQNIVVNEPIITPCEPKYNVASSTNIRNTNTGDYFNSVTDALTDCDTSNGDTIELLGDIVISSQITLNRPVVLEGNGYTIDAAFAKTSNSNNSAIGVQSDNVTIQNLKLTASGDAPWPEQLHGVNVYNSVNIILSNLDISGFEGSGIVVNSSTVNASNITTDDNGWHAINVDQKTSQSSVLNIYNTSSHGEDSPTTPHIFVDDISKDVIVNDLDEQYEFVEFTFNDNTARAYTLKGDNNGNEVGTTPPTKPTLSGVVIYDAIADVLPSSYPSLGFQATQTYEVGDKIEFLSGTSRDLVSGAVTLTSWACQNGQWQNGDCETTPGATFNHPITLNIYEVTDDGDAGSLIASVTDTFAIPYRPSANTTCTDTKQWMDTNGDCFNGFNHVIVFDLSGITVPDTIIYGVAYDTQSYGVSPTGANGPYNALNVALNTDVSSAPYIGTDVVDDEIFWDSTYGGRSRGFNTDSGWNYRVAVAFTAEAPAVTPTEPVVSSGGGGGGGRGTRTAPTPQVLGASTDNEVYALLEAIKQRLIELLEASQGSMVNTTPSGTVLGDSSSNTSGGNVTVSTSSEEVIEQNEVIVESDELLDAEEENEGVNDEKTTNWTNHIWWLIVLLLLIVGWHTWRKMSKVTPS